MTKEDLIRDLKNLGVTTGDTLFCHTSLSKVGNIDGTPQTYIDALKETVTASGNLVMPAFNITPQNTPHLGIVAETFRRNFDVLHSGHPAANYACWGADSVQIAGTTIFSDEGLSFENGKNSPLYRLYKLEKPVWILMTGTDYNTCTALHLAENLATWNGKPVFTEKMEITGRGTFTVQDVAYNTSDFHLVATAFENRFWGDETMLRFGKIGNAGARLVNFKLFVDYAADWMFKNRGLRK